MDVGVIQFGNSVPQTLEIAAHSSYDRILAKSKGSCVDHTATIDRGEGSRPRVAVAIAAYNQAHFLPDALASVARQTRPADEVLVVDDGSQDDPGAVTVDFGELRLIRQTNGGLAAARNTALATTDCDYVIFLDADDALEPAAIAAGLACFERAPGAGFVYGAHRRVGPAFDTTVPYCLHRLSRRPDHDLLLGNAVGMHGTVMYRVEALRAAGGFDETLARCEDYDVYLRMGRLNEIACHDVVVAAYRQHGSNMTADHRAMLHSVLAVLDRYRPSEEDRDAARAWRTGRARWRAHYAVEALKAAAQKLALRQFLAALADTLVIPPAPLARDIARRVARFAGGRL